jgi:serine/threonine-protein phosphatase 2A activator
MALMLPTLDEPRDHVFVPPSKKIHHADDVSAFQTTPAYRDLVAFVLQLNRALIPRKTSAPGADQNVQSWPLGSNVVEFSEPVRRLQGLLAQLADMIEQAPLDQGPRRFGNVAFRHWYQIVEQRASHLLADGLASELLHAEVELNAYFLGSFGSPQRLDYGTGHELSFLAFLACIWKLHGFSDSDPGVEERGIVLGVIQP